MKIGIYGGAFDPIHNEHLKIIKESRESLGLDKLLLLLSYMPPHKEIFINDFFVRKEMLERATSDLPYVEIEELEYYRNSERNCSFEVLAELKEKYKGHDLVYIMGGDSLEKFHTWVHPEIIAKLMPVAVVPRRGYDDLNKALSFCEKTYGMKVEILPFFGDDVSSSLIKAYYELGDTPPKELVTEEINSFIKERGLYRRYEKLLKKLESELDEEKFIHTKGVVLYGVKMANKLGLKFEKVFLACLLHDCAKRRTDADGKYLDVPRKVVHQFLGADVAETEYGISDNEILDAIRFHTTGKTAMTTLGKLVYSADMLEENRDFEGVERLREIMEGSFDRGFAECIKSSVEVLSNAGRDIYYLTLDCYNYYVK